MADNEMRTWILLVPMLYFDSSLFFYQLL